MRGSLEIDEDIRVAVTSTGEETLVEDLLPLSLAGAGERPRDRQDLASVDGVAAVVR